MIHVRLPPELADELVAAQRKLDVPTPLSAIVRKALEDWLEGRKKVGGRR